ncbi:MAG: dihydrodipicolinate reductase C-terminal domain-containing protein, partial [Bacteroidales bacterium]|nr:dihydrodipicolinate reductase C-terminal domain-containing protein [Bacteroidales bacterium]
PSANLDSPSGTAKSVAVIIETNFGKAPAVTAVRAGHIPGIHQAGYESELDRINILHEAFSRRGFANGAVLAAGWTQEYPGVHEFRELLENNFNKIIGIC